MENLGKLLLVTGLVLTSLGILVLVLSRVSNMVKLPGDIQIQTEGFSCFLPLATSLLLSIIATIVLNLILRIINR